MCPSGWVAKVVRKRFGTLGFLIRWCSFLPTVVCVPEVHRFVGRMLSSIFVIIKIISLKPVLPCQVHKSTKLVLVRSRHGWFFPEKVFDKSKHKRKWFRFLPPWWNPYYIWVPNAVLQMTKFTNEDERLDEPNALWTLITQSVDTMEQLLRVWVKIWVVIILT